MPLRSETDKARTESSRGVGGVDSLPTTSNVVYARSHRLPAFVLATESVL